MVWFQFRCWIQKPSVRHRFHQYLEFQSPGPRTVRQEGCTFGSCTTLLYFYVLIWATGFCVDMDASKARSTMLLLWDYACWITWFCKTFYLTCWNGLHEPKIHSGGTGWYNIFNIWTVTQCLSCIQGENIGNQAGNLHQASGMWHVHVKLNTVNRS